MPIIRVRKPADFVPFSKDAVARGIHERIEGQVRLYPLHTALRTARVEYTYAEMNGLANSIAAEILSAAGTQLAQAAILQANSPEIVISILAALKAHKAYVPLDPNFPKERLKIMFEDAQPAVLITDDANLALAEELAGNQVRIVNVSRIPRSADAPNPAIPCDPPDRAYILFTSGSSGRPKGIAFRHGFLVHHTMGLVNTLFFSPGDRVTWLHSSSFAASIVDLYCCLMTGATLYPWDAKTQGFIGLADWIVRERISTFQWIPSAFRQFLRTVPPDFVFRDIRMVIMASEPLTLREVELFRRHFPEGSHLVNQVGTSEAGNYRLYPVDHQVPIETTNVPAGFSPSPDRAVVILDDNHRPLPSGSVGEIGVQSLYMCDGYWRDEALTQSKFIRIEPDAPPVYLTGDLGRIEPDDCLIHLGRKDFQVKIRGYRVELAEVEHVLSSAPGVADAAASVFKNRLGEDQLVACIVPKSPGSFDRRTAQEYLESRVPDYMVPRHYTLLDRLPTLPTGKTDRGSLPNPFGETKTDTTTPSPEATSSEAVAIFEELLESDGLRPETNFMEAGGDSLLTAVLLQRVHQRFGVRIAAQDFMATPTPTHLAGLIGRAAEDGARKPAPSIPPPASSQSVASRRPAHAEDSLATKNLIIIGAGGFAREVFSWATQAIAAGRPYRIKGFLDTRANALADFDYPVGILGDTAAYAIQEDDVFIGALGDPKDKTRFYGPVVERGGRFVNLIHPLANVAGNARLGSGIVVGPFSALNADVTIGDYVGIGTFSNIGHDAVVGNWCHIASHCGVNGRSRLGDGVFFGSHACLVPGVTVGEGAFVGAGSVVVRNVPPRVKVFGNPAAAIGSV